MALELSLLIALLGLCGVLTAATAVLLGQPLGVASLLSLSVLLTTTQLSLITALPSVLLLLLSTLLLLLALLAGELSLLIALLGLCGVLTASTPTSVLTASLLTALSASILVLVVPGHGSGISAGMVPSRFEGG